MIKKIIKIIVCAGYAVLNIPSIQALYDLHDIEKMLEHQQERVTYTKIKKLTPTISQQEFLKTMLSCINCMMQQLVKKQSWLSDRMCPTGRDIVAGAFKSPYVQRVIVTPESNIAFFGDIHGSAHSLLRCLRQLCDLGYLRDDFSIAQDHPNFYCIFLGDYVDRGCYGLEVLYLLMRLKIANPDRVFLVRGNHENVPANRVWGFGEELSIKYGKTFDLSMVSDFFTLLPIACYLGCQAKDGRRDFVLCCHGGPDVSFDPTNILASPEQIALQKIEAFNYHSYTSKKIALLKPNIEQQRSLEQAKKKAKERNITWIDNKNTQPDNWLMKFGFIWTDFDVYEENKDILQFTRRCWLLGRSITKALLETNDDKIRVHAVMRGHQHHGRLYEDLVKHKGFVRSWDGIVNTLFCGPAAKAFVKNDHEKKFDYDSFVIITTAQTFKDWSFTHWWHRLSSNSWSF